MWKNDTEKAAFLEGQLMLALARLRQIERGQSDRIEDIERRTEATYRERLDIAKSKIKKLEAKCDSMEDSDRRYQFLRKHRVKVHVLKINHSVGELDAAIDKLEPRPSKVLGDRDNSVFPERPGRGIPPSILNRRRFQ